MCPSPPFSRARERAYVSSRVLYTPRSNAQARRVNCKLDIIRLDKFALQNRDSSYAPRFVTTII